MIPSELHDLGTDPNHAGECRRLSAALAQWGLRVSQRTTRSEQQINNGRGKAERRGILIGVWDEADIPAELWSGYLRDKTLIGRSAMQGWRPLWLGFAVMAASLFAGPLQAQIGAPPIRIIFPFAAGGSGDTWSRD